MAIVDGHIRCSDCGEFKTTDQFQPSIVSRGCGVCRPCKQKAKKVYNENNREKTNAARTLHRKNNLEKHKETRRVHYQKNPETYRRYNLDRYGVSPEEYDAMLSDQGGGCACCGAKTNKNGKRLFVDHCHESGIIRGILCMKCNSGIGSLGDSVEGLRRALAYLARAEINREPTMRINLLQGRA